MRREKMKILCPHCGHAEPDDFELIDVNERHDDFCCASCRQAFTVFIRNCSRCDFEQALTWRLDAVPEGLEALPCVQCGHVELAPDAFDDI